MTRHVIARREEARVGIDSAFGKLGKMCSAYKLVRRLVEADVSVLTYAEKLKTYPARRLYCGIVCAAECIGVGSSTVGNVCALC